MNRMVVAAISLCVGILVAIADAALTGRGAPEQAPASGGKDPGLIFCTTLYGVAYAVGRRLYRWQGAAGDLRAMEGQARWHMAALNAIGGGLLLLSWLDGGERPELRIATGIGVLMLVEVARDAWLWLRAKRSGETEQSVSLVADRKAGQRR